MAPEAILKGFTVGIEDFKLKRSALSSARSIQA